MMFPQVESYFYGLIHPIKTHHWLKFGIAPDSSQARSLPRLDVSLAISWGLAIVRGMVQLFLANLVIEAFMAFQNDDLFFFDLIDTQDALWPYYIFIFSTAIDVIFFPIMSLVVIEFWNFIIRFYARWLKVEGDHFVIADQITTVALSSNFFLVVPLIGDYISKLCWPFLIYAGLRHNLGASRSVSVVILLTPLVLTSMVIGSLLLVMYFCLA